MKTRACQAAAIALVACGMLAGPTQSDANTIELDLTLDADHGFNFTFGLDWFFQTPLTSFDTATLSNGDTLIVDFVFLGGKGLQITDTQGGDQIEFQFFGPLETGVIQASSRLDLLQYAGEPLDTTFFDENGSVGNFIPCICNVNVTDSSYTLFAGRLTTTVISGMETPVDLDQLRIQVSSGQPVEVVSSVPIPAGIWLFLSAIGALAAPRATRRC